MGLSFIHFKGKGGGGGGTTNYSERPLTPEERQLISTQNNYVQSLQPAVNNLVNKGTSKLNNTITPDYNSLYSNAQSALANNTSAINSLASGKLPDSYAANKSDYYKQVYGDSLGSILKDKAASGVIGSSALNSSVDSLQKNLSSQMSQDYTNDLKTQSGLLSQQASNITAPLSLSEAINQASFNDAAQYLGLASGQGSQGTNVLNAIGNLHNNATTATTSSGGKGLF